MCVLRFRLYKTTMKNIYKIVNEVPTHLITWGNPLDCKGNDVIVCITGNPGITDYYIEFGSELHKETSLPVCIIGHTGHEEVHDEDTTKLHNHKHLFDLKGQAEHKLDLIKNHIDKNSKIHIIGHSIGAWMLIELMDKNHIFLKDKILSTNLLFPTVQNMGVTKNGVFLNKVVRRLHPIIMFLVNLLPLLPAILVEFFVTCYIKFHSLPSSYMERIQKILNPKSLENILLLAYNEMDTVLKLNSEGVKKLCSNTNIIYSCRDNWAPVEYVEDLKSIKPSLELKKVDINHAFVLKSSERVALMVSEYINPRISKK